MFDRLTTFVAAIGPAMAGLVGIAVVGVSVAWIVNKALGPRKGG